MPLAINEDHLTLADTAADFLTRHRSLGTARAALEADVESLPPWWVELVSLGWPGLHIAEEHGGSGYGMFELAVIVEQLGRAMAPGPFVPSAVVSALLAGGEITPSNAERLARFAAGTEFGAVSLDDTVTLTEGAAEAVGLSRA